MKICPKCNSEHDKKGTFCSRKCANSRTFSQESKDKIKNKLLSKSLVPVYCNICKKYLKHAYYAVNNRILYCIECKRKIKEEQNRIDNEKFKSSNRTCKKCGKLLEYKYGIGLFCNIKCCNSKYISEEYKDKIRKKLKGGTTLRKGISYNYTKFNNIIKICPVCNTSFNTWRKTNIFCSKKCAINKNKNLSGVERRGGYRGNGGRGKRGWYKGYWCDSSWELAWIIYNLENSIKFERNLKGFEYVFEGKIRKYYPDFILEDGSYVEIKGYITVTDVAKMLYFKHPLTLLDEMHIKPYISYAKQKYGKKFIELYDKSYKILEKDKTHESKNI